MYKDRSQVDEDDLAFFSSLEAKKWLKIIQIMKLFFLLLLL